MSLFFGKPRTECGVKVVPVRRVNQDAATPDLLWLTKRRDAPGWELGEPDGYVGTEWKQGRRLVWSANGLTLQEAKALAAVVVQHSLVMSKVYADPAFVALRSRVLKRQEVTP